MFTPLHECFMLFSWITECKRSNFWHSWDELKMDDIKGRSCRSKLQSLQKYVCIKNHLVSGQWTQHQPLKGPEWRGWLLLNFMLQNTVKCLDSFCYRQRFWAEPAALGFCWFTDLLCSRSVEEPELHRSLFVWKRTFPRCFYAERLPK